MDTHWLFNFVYVLLKWFYNSLYFYFFVFTIIIVPMINICVAKEVAERK